MIGYCHKLVFDLKKRTAEKEIPLMDVHAVVDSTFLYPIPLQWQYLCIILYKYIQCINLYIVGICIKSIVSLSYPNSVAICSIFGVSSMSSEEVIFCFFNKK